jgi:hypothetical protein
MSCIYCAGKQARRTCKYCQPPTIEPSPAKVATVATVEEQRPQSLFALTDRRELVCTLCSHVIPNGRDQAYLRLYHGTKHVRAGDAIENRNGLPAGAVRYFVK